MMKCGYNNGKRMINHTAPSSTIMSHNATQNLFRKKREKYCFCKTE